MHLRKCRTDRPREIWELSNSPKWILFRHRKVCPACLLLNESGKYFANTICNAQATYSVCLLFETNELHEHLAPCLLPRCSERRPWLRHAKPQCGSALSWLLWTSWRLGWQANTSQMTDKNNGQSSFETKHVSSCVYMIPKNNLCKLKDVLWGLLRPKLDSSFAEEPWPSRIASAFWPIKLPRYVASPGTAHLWMRLLPRNS